MITDLAKTAASVYTGGLAGGGSSGTGGGGKSGTQQGALINYFDKVKGQGNSATDGGSGGSAGGGVAPSSGS